MRSQVPTDDGRLMNSVASFSLAATTESAQSAGAAVRASSASY